MGGCHSRKIKHYLYASEPTRFELQRQLIKACYELDTESAFQALELGVSANLQFLKKKFLMQPLHAVFLDNINKATTKKARRELLEMLLDFGADVNAVDNSNRTVVHYLCTWDLSTKANEGPEVLTLLLRHGALPHQKDKDGNTPLHLCCKEMEKGVFSVLTSDERVDINTENNLGETCLHTAARVGNSMLAKKLLQLGCDVNKQCHKGDTPLHNAFHCNQSGSRKLYLPGGSESTVHMLLANGAKGHILNKRHETPCTLALAAELHYLSDQIFESILKSADTLNSQDDKGNTLLHMCYLKEPDSESSFKLMSTTYLNLINHGIHGNILNNQGNTALGLCISLLYEHRNSYPWIPVKFPEMFLNHVKAGTDLKHMPMAEKAIFLNLCRSLKHSDMVMTLKVASHCGFTMMLSAEEETYLLGVNEDEYAELLSLLRSTENVMPLRQICANVIRMNMLPNAMISANQLRLPPSIINYIMCKI